jgi:hypothetical protein
MARQYIKRRIDIGTIRGTYNRAGLRPPSLYNDIAKMVEGSAKRTRDLGVAVRHADAKFIHEVVTMLRDDGFTVNRRAVTEAESDEYCTVLYLSW